MTAFAPGPVASLKIRVTPDLMSCVPGASRGVWNPVGSQSMCLKWMDE